ncbi:MAG: serine/threonine protein kinase, partial [Oscillospiraceae bacterium]|nr:serine/threonine protein kinase [Oscillospiraceae bacterium]
MEDNYIGKFLDNRYEILEKIGSGGMATVYKARCHRLNRFVAIKILKADLAENEDLRRRFHAESQAVAMLSHPNIVAVYDVNHTDNLDYIVMELIDGITLKQYINRKGILNWKEALHFTTQITKALSHAHSRGIIHRDIKPHNIMILRDGSVKVADFGIARLLSTKNTLTQEALGSVHYISPEQAKGGQVDARSDIYSLGVVMYEMLTSRLPFEGDSPVSVAIQHISSIPLQPKEINPNIPTGLAQITMHAMEPNMDLRYPSADALLADLEEFRKNPSVEFSYSSVPETDDGMDKTIVSGGSL